ncbi:MAG: OmpA family protein [Paludibacteraceae bacterium]|nr:OmpA family protein [Paludibacteraceae bacterium]
MKKSLFILSLLCFAVFATAQEKEQKLKGAHPYKVSENKELAPGYSHWSLTPHVGFNWFDGDFNSEKQHAVAIPNAGIDLEYSFNPVWGLGLTYMYDMYTVTGKPGGNNVDTLLNGHMHKMGLYVSMDFMGLFFPNAKKKIFSAHAVIGGGYALYKSTTMYHDDPSGDHPTWKRGNTINYINEDGVLGPSYMTDYAGQLYLQAGMNFEFNLNRTLALGVRATYNYFINDYIDGRGYAGMNAVASKNNDGIVDVTLNMRFKLAAVKKTHMRNISSLALLEQKSDDGDKKVKSDVDPICCHDTIYIRHDSIIVREVIKESKETIKEDNKNIYYVYFDNGKSRVREDGLITIQQVADRLAEDPSLYAVVTGYCDNTGSEKLNYRLGDIRANNVIEELREEHGVDDSHMYSTGLGKLVGRRSTGAYGPNRRAAIRLVDKATFESMKKDLEAKRASRPGGSAAAASAAYNDDDDDYENVNPDDIKIVETPAVVVKTIPLNESARPERVNEYKQRASETVTTDKNTTLSKLARQYYNNTYCWVYIYIANKDKIANPNAINPGTKLIIPELTAKEMRITKDESLVLFGNARQNR